MIKSAVIFDCDGVIADTEEHHFLTFAQTLREQAARLGRLVLLERDLYYARYHHFGDHEALAHMLLDADLPVPPELLEALVHHKGGLMLERLSRIREPLPGVRALVAMLDLLGVPGAVCSSAARREVEYLLRALGLAEFFPVVVGEEDVTHTKPDPEGYRTAFNLLNQRHGERLVLERSLAVEDSPGGAAAARAAGLRVLGVANTHPVDELTEHMDWVVEDLSQVTQAHLVSWLSLDLPDH